jgi:hypothetical protein
MAVGGFVVDRRAALQDFLQLRGVEDFALARGAPHLFGQRQRGAAVAIGHPHQDGARFRIERQSPPLDLLGMRVEFFDRARIERMKHQDTCARQKRGIEFERWVFGGGADQHHGAVFHHGQK